MKASKTSLMSLREKQHQHICRNSCMGERENHGSCCKVGDRDYIIGAIVDSDKFLEDLRVHFKNRKIEFQDVLYSYEEGSKLFPDKSNYQRKAAYPAIKLNTSKDSLPCIFYSEEVKSCTIYSIRPKSCREYLCNYLKKLELIHKQ